MPQPRGAVALMGLKEIIYHIVLRIWFLQIYNAAKGFCIYLQSK